MDPYPTAVAEAEADRAATGHRPHRWLRWCSLGLLTGSLLLGACATAPDPEAPAAAMRLLHDELFPDAPTQVDATQALVMSPQMRQFASTQRKAAGSRFDIRRTLLDALTERDQLRLEYDNSQTFTAAEAFDRRAGNCLSLVLMTAAFARHLDLPVRFQAVKVEPFYSRVTDMTLAAGHINVVLSSRQRPSLTDPTQSHDLTVDFVAAPHLRQADVRALPEHTVLAMFANNRSAETLAAGQHAQAYAWAREALRQDPTFLPGMNTLAVVYLRAGHLAPAEAALRQVLMRLPDDEAALSNLAGLLRRTDRLAEADAVAQRLARLQPYPPFHFLDQGRIALREGRVEQARQLIGRELQRQPFQHEAHFWAAVVDVARGDPQAAEEHLRLAVEHSDNPQLQSRYSAKLASLRAALPVR